MCLDIVYKGKQKKEALVKLPESGYYWKTVNQHGKVKGRYYPICFSLPECQPFKLGWNTTKPKYIGRGYRIAFHLHKTKKAAKTWIGTTVRCIIKKKDIVAIGTQYLGGENHLTIVTKKFWIPKPKKKTA